MIYHIVQGNYNYGYFTGEIESIKEYIAISANTFTGKLKIEEIMIRQIDNDAVYNLKDRKEELDKAQKEYDIMKIDVKKMFTVEKK